MRPTPIGSVAVLVRPHAQVAKSVTDASGRIIFDYDDQGSIVGIHFIHAYAVLINGQWIRETPVAKRWWQFWR